VFSGERVTAGCLDVAVERERDLDGGTPVIRYVFGNRCARAAVVDLAHANVVGRTANGNEVILTPFDPKHEIRALELDGRWVGSETLAYPVEASLAQVCVDAGSITHANAQWVCFARSGS